MPIDALATETHFLDHALPVWRALPEWARGTFYVTRSIADHAARRGLEVVHDLPEDGPGHPPMLTAAYGDVKRARHNGRTAIAFIEHGAGQSYQGDSRSATSRSYAGSPDRDDVGLFLVPNEDAGSRFRVAYPGARVEVVGSPKVDAAHVTPRPPNDPPTVAVSFHWDCRISHETRTAFFEYRNVIAPLRRHYQLLGHGHPRLFADRHAALSSFYTRQHIPIVRDFDEVLELADLFVCDNSSALFEFPAITGRPVVVVNSHRYRRPVNHGLRFKPSRGCPIRVGQHFCGASHVGLQVDRPSQLAPTIKAALADPPDVAAAREAALALVYAHRGEAAERAAAALLEWSGVREPQGRVARAVERVTSGLVAMSPGRMIRE